MWKAWLPVRTEHIRGANDRFFIENQSATKRPDKNSCESGTAQDLVWICVTPRQTQSRYSARTDLRQYVHSSDIRISVANLASHNARLSVPKSFVDFEM
jgi:hypothetical protein